MALQMITDGRDYRLTGMARITPTVPVGNYNINFDPERGEFYLTAKPAFTFPPKLYGAPEKFAERVLSTYKSPDRRGSGMGVLGSGPKGCGKTIEAKLIAAKSDMPVLSLTDAFHGYGFTNFLERLPCACVIIIDEFEKLYEKEEHRNYFLTLLDGVGTSRHLFVLTSNNPNVGEFFDSRPGRIYYHKHYSCLPPEIIKEMIEDNVPEGKLREAIKQTVSTLFNISPDCLMAIIAESLRYNEVPTDFMDILNVKNDPNVSFDITVEIDSYKVVGDALNPEHPKHYEAREFCRYAHSYGHATAVDNYGEAEAFVTKSRGTYQESFVKLFKRSLPGHVHIETSYLREVGDQTGTQISPTRSISWQNHDIKDLATVDGKIHITTHKGETLVATPSAPVGRGHGFRAL